MESDEPTCGQEMAADAEVPEQLGRLMGHVAGNMEAHARWVGAGGAGRREHDALSSVARELRAVSDAAARAAAAMTAMRDIPAAPHDPTRLDRPAQARWMQEKIDLQERFARLLLNHADVSRRALAGLVDGPAAAEAQEPPKTSSPTTDVAIAVAVEADLPAVLRLYDQGGMGGAVDGNHPAEGAAHVFRRITAHPDHVVYVAWAGGTIVGTFALLIMTNLAHQGAPSAIVEDVCVDLAWRRRGVGRALMAFAIDRARARGCYKLALSSNQHRADAHTFYRSLGFEAHGLSFHVALAH